MLEYLFKLINCLDAVEASFTVEAVPLTNLLDGIMAPYLHYIFANILDP